MTVACGSGAVLIAARSSRRQTADRPVGVGARTRHQRGRATILAGMPGADQDHRRPVGTGAAGGVAVHHGGAVTDARVAAAEICADLRGGDLLDPAFDRRTARLDARDRRWVRELVYGMLRRRARLDAYLDARVRGGIGPPRRRPARPAPPRRLAAAAHGERAGVRGHRADRRAGEASPRHGREQARERRAAPPRSRARNARRCRRRRIRSTRSRSTDRIRAGSSRAGSRAGAWPRPRKLLEANNREAPLVARPYHVVREQLEAMLESAGIHVERRAARARQHRVVEPGVVAHGARTVPPGTVPPAGSGVDARDAVRVRADRRRRRRSLRGAGRKVRRAVAQRVARVRERPLVSRELQRVVENARSSRDRHAARVRRRRALPGDQPGRPRARRRAVHGNGHVPPSSRRALASQDLRPRGDGVASSARFFASAAERRASRADCSSTARARSSPKRTTSRLSVSSTSIPDWRLDPPPEGVVPAAVLDDGLLRVLPQRHGTDGAFAARLRRARHDAFGRGSAARCRMRSRSSADFSSPT